MRPRAGASSAPPTIAHRACTGSSIASAQRRRRRPSGSTGRHRRAGAPLIAVRARARSSSTRSRTTCPGRTASGLPVGVGVIAVDPRGDPARHARVRPGLRACRGCGRRQSAIKGNIIDLWMPSTDAGARPGGAVPSRSPSTVEPVETPARPRRMQSLAACVASALAAAATSPAPLETDAGQRLAGPFGLARPHRRRSRSTSRTGTVLFAHNASLPVAPASNEKLPVSWAALTQLGPRLPLPHRGVRRRPAGPGRSWDGDLVLKGFGDPTLTTADIDRLAAAHPRARDPLGDGTYPRRRVVLRRRSAAPPAGRPYFVGGETPPLSAPSSVDRARGWPALSPPLLAARTFRDALVRRGVTIASRPGLGVAPRRTATPSLASDVSDPLRRDRAAHEPRQRQLLRRDAAQAPRNRSTAGSARRARAAASSCCAECATAGIPVAGVRIVDGSGSQSLDRHDPARRWRR